MFRTLECPWGLSEGSRRELAVLFRELSRFLSGELGGLPGPRKSGRKSDDLWVTLPCHGRT